MLRMKKYKKQTARIQILLIALIMLTAYFLLIVSEEGFSKNVSNRALKELVSTAEFQANMAEHVLDEQYLPLKTIAGIIESGVDFDSEEMIPVLDSMRQTYHLCMLGFADLDGNVVNYLGEELPSIRERNYFSLIVDGSRTQVCEYLFTTKLINEPRMMFSIPVYRNNELYGVLFESKEIEVLKEALFQTELFNGSECIFICDSDFNVLVANECAEDILKNVGQGDMYSAFKEAPVFASVREQKNSLVSAGVVDAKEQEAYLAYTSFGENEWTLFCKTDYASARQAYASNLNVMRQLILKIALVFTLILILVLGLVCTQIRQRNKEDRILKHYYDNYNILLREMNCALIEYDLQNNTLYSNETFFEIYGIRNINGPLTKFEAFMREHPEFDFAELDKELVLAKTNRHTYSFESIIELNNHEIRWLKIILVPISDADGVVNKIIAIISDTTDVHSEFDEVTTMLDQVPSGLHRCYLSDPIHLEYFSDGLCKMLGYTREEFYEKVQPNNRYSNVIYEEDRKKFGVFVRELAVTEGTKSCEYRMVCKDGSLLNVSDIMDAKRSASGIMYGYSVVVDLTQYQEARLRAERELEQVREQLEQTRVKVSTSQMQPHFLYNALASIRELVLEDPQYASDLIYDFTLHLRACIKSMASDYLIPFKQEIENIRAYVNIEKMRFGEKLKIVYEIAEESFDIIPLSIQPLVENAIRHGIHERGAKGGTVYVRSYTIDDNYIVEVSDDGVGFSVDTVMQDISSGKKDSTGLINLIYRFDKLMQAVVEIESKVGEGTKITVKIPKAER